MNIREINAMRGPNYWSIRRHKLIVMVLDLEDMEEKPSNKIDGFPKVKPKSNIFDDTFELKHVPKKVVLDTLNENLLKEYKNSKKIINQLSKNDIKKNRVVALCILMLIFETMMLVFN